MKRIVNLLRVAVIALIGAAVAQELRKPAALRTWHGTLGGFIPYDFRMPTMERIRETYWNEEDPHILQPMPFGVGWGVNLPAVGKRISHAA